MRVSTNQFSQGTTVISRLMLVLITLCSLVIPEIGRGQIVAWQLNGATGSEATFNANTINANLNTSTLTRTGSVTASALANAFGSSNYPGSTASPGTRADAVNNNRGFNFTISAKAGYKVSLSTLNVRFRRSGTGPNAFVWRWSTDGTNFTDITPDISYTSTTTGGDAQTQINLSGISALQNVASGTTIYFRLNAWGAAAATVGSGTFAIGRSLTNGATDYSLAIGGTVAVLANPPTVTTTTASGITTTGASSGGNVTDDGGASVSAKGVAYGTSSSPIITGSITTDGNGTGSYTSTLSGLSVNTRYYYRAYATNTQGTSYGSESNFYTLANTPGTPTVNNATSSTLDITLNGNSNPPATQFAIQETGSGNFVQSIDGSLGGSPDWQTIATWGTPRTVTGLAQSTSYTFQVKARNGDNVETGYGTSAGGTTLLAGSPLITASALTAFGSQCINGTYGPNTFTITGTNLTTAPVTVATLNGFSYSTDDITYSASLSITQPGGSFSQLVYVKFNPTLAQSYNGNITVGGGGASNYDVAASGSGINTPASVTTGGQSGITQVAASLQGSYTEACSSVTAYGIEYSTSSGFINGTQVPSSNQSFGSFSSSLSGLSANTTYYYKAYATDNAGTHYGSESSFTTASLTAPVATAATNNATTSFDANWDAVTGATSYRLDVSTSSNFIGNTPTTMAQWTFPTGSADATVDVANANNSGKTLSTVGGTGAISYSNQGSLGAGDFCATANTWTSGSGTKYWQLEVNTTGLYGVKVSSKQRSSDTGPKDFKLQYRIGVGGTWTDVTGGAVTVGNDNFITGIISNLGLPAACDNQSSVFLRWIMTSNNAVNGSLASGGTSRIDDIAIAGFAPAFVAGYNNLTVNGLTQTVSGLTSGTTYYYRVRAFSTNSTSDNSNTITATTCSQITASAGTGGSISPSGVTTICDGSDQTYTITADPCYSITDVIVDGVSQGPISTYTFTGVTTDHTISASFTFNTYAITVTAGANGSITPGTGNVNCGDNQTYTITPDACYSIVDVLVDNVSQGPITTYTFTDVQAPHSISATFALNTYTITATAGSNGSISPVGATTVNCGSNQTYTITPDPGYLVDDVLVDNVSQGAITTYTFTDVQASHTISVSFVQAVTFTITASAGTGGSISPSGSVSVNAGDNQTFNITADPCYSISDVIVDGVSQGVIGSYTFTNVLATHTISASFTLNTYAITVTAGSNGSVTPGTGNVNCGSNATYTITPDACYSIVDVLVDNVSQGPITTYTFTDVQAPHTISASFVINTFTITATAGSNGSISPAGVTTVNCGSGQSYTITPDPGYQVADVLVNGSSVGAVTTYTFSNVQAASTIDASFVAIPPTLSSTALTAFGDVCLNNTAGPNTFTINGIYLTNADVNVGPLNGFTFSTDDITYNTSLTLSQPGGTYSQLIYVKFTPVAVQSYSGSIPVNGGGFAGNADVSASGGGINTAPSVTTGSSSGITQIAATLNGTITLNGCSPVISYGIEYSTTNGFSNGSGTQVAGGTLNLGSFSSVISSGLNANTTYYYKAYATNNGGISYGSQQSFTTLGLDAPVATAATNINSTSFTANWDAVTGATGYRLDVSTSNTFTGAPVTLAGWTFPTSGATVTPDQGLPANSAKTLTCTGGTIGDVTGATTRAATANSWASGSGTKFWQVDIDATGYYNIKLSSKQRASSSGPRDFKIQYKVGAGAWTDVPGGTVPALADNFTSGVIANLALPAACDNQSALSIRWIMTSNTSVGGATVTTGTSRIDDIIVSGALPLYVSGYQNLSVAGTSQAVTGLTAATTYYYRVRAESANSTSANSNIITAITCTPASAGTVSGSSPLCIGATATYSANAVVLSGGTGAWSSSDNNVATVDINSGLVTGLAEGQASIIYTVTGGCDGTVSSSSIVNILPDASVASVSGAATLCASTSSTFTANGVVLSGGTGSWSSSNPAVANVNPTSGLVSALTPGTTTITYTITGGCNGTPTASANLTVASGAAPVVTGPANVCPFVGNATPITYTATSTGATSFNWSLPPNVSLVSQTNNSGVGTITVTFANGFTTQANKQIRVTAVSACGTSAMTIYYLQAQNPSTPQPITASTTNVCPSLGTNVPITYFIPKVAGASSYIWNAQSGTTTISHPNGLGENDTLVTVTFTAGFTTSNITVQAVNSCGTSGGRALTITRANPATPGLISGPVNVCANIAPAGTAATYAVAQQPTVTNYTWSVPAGAIGLTGQGSNSVSFTFPVGYTGGTISVIATNGCGTSTARNLTVATLSPATPSVIDVVQTTACPNRVFTYSLASMPANATSVNWTYPAGGSVVTQTAFSITIAYPSTAVTGTVTAQASNNCGNSVIRSLSVFLPACPPEEKFPVYTKGNVTAPVELFEAQVFPNPAVSDFKLRVKSLDKNSQVTVRVLDLQGRELSRMLIMPDALKTFGSNLKPGAYMIEVLQGNKRTVQKLIKL